MAPLSAMEFVPARAVSVYPVPQLVTTAFTGVANWSPLGSVSVYDTPVKFVSTSLLLTRISSRLASPTNIVFGLKDLLSEGGDTAITVIVALAGEVFVITTGVPPSLPSAFKLLAGIVLIRFPEVIEDTLTST